MRARRTAAVCAGALLLAGCAAAPLSTPLPSPPEVTPSRAPAHTDTPPPVASATPPDAATLEFPPPRELPPSVPDDPTPEAVIDAFHRLVRDPALSYRAEGHSRWVFGGTELVTSTTLARSGDDLHVHVGDASGPQGQAILVDGSAAARIGRDGAWMATDATPIRLIDGLRAALVIADLGAEPGGAGYRLLLEGGFDGRPQAALGSADGRPAEEVTEIVVDDAGRPQRAVFHRWDPLAPDPEDAIEGVAVYTFSSVGDPVEIPPLPVQPGEAPQPAQPAPMVDTPLLAAGLSVEMPAPTEERTDELTLNDDAGDPLTVAVDRLVASSVDGLRFEAGTAVLPGTGLTDDELIDALRSAILSRTSGSELRGFRPVTVGAVPGQEFVSDSYDDRLPPRAILLRARIVVLGDQAVVLSVAGPHDLVATAEADRFLASLVTDSR